MKKNVLFVISIMAMLCLGCEPNEPTLSKKVETGIAKNITPVSVFLSGTLHIELSDYKNVEYGFMFSKNKSDIITNEINLNKTFIVNRIHQGKYFTLEVDDLEPSTKYYYRAFVYLNNKRYELGGVNEFKTLGISENPNMVIEYENGYGYVNLGLSVKWAFCNIGANLPEEYGDCFAWGETETKHNYSWGNYRLASGDRTSLKKYCTDINFSHWARIDNKTTLELEDDAANKNWGGKWRIPTRTEADELRKKCYWKWVSQNGIYGYKVISIINGNYIFIPAAGGYTWHGDSFRYEIQKSGWYWSSSLAPNAPCSAYGLYFTATSVGEFSSNRDLGYSIRPVCP